MYPSGRVRALMPSTMVARSPGSLNELSVVPIATPMATTNATSGLRSRWCKSRGSWAEGAASNAPP